MVQRLLLDVTARVFAACLAASAAVSGCAMPAQITGLQFATREGKKPIQRVYRLGVGDKLKVSVFGEDNLSGQFEVSAIGQISMPLIGKMPAKVSPSMSSGKASPASSRTAISRTPKLPSKC
jgi:polysaccharide export outer membrane protein